MNKFISFLVVCCPLLFSNIFAQWTQFTGIPNQNIEAVQAWDQNNIYASQPEKMLRSTDGGLNWDVLPVADAIGTVYLTTSFYDFQILSPGVIIAVGIASMGNQEIIYKSNNNGVSWSIVNINNNGTWPRISNAIHFPSSSTGFVVGTNGRILKTTNGGNNWTTSTSGTTAELKDVYFTGTQNGYTVGSERVLRTVNGGSSWTSTIFSGSYFKSIHFPSSNVGYAVGENRKFIKTINAGLSWTLSIMNIPTNADLNSVYFVSDNEGYVTGSDGVIYHTNSGGVYWEKLQLNSELNDVYFINQSNGFLVGDGGQLLSCNGNVLYKPVSNISVPTTSICNDSTLILSNLSDPSLSFQWLINGVPFSTNFDTSFTFSNPNQSDTISLVSFNGAYYDTLNKIISVQSDLEFVINGGIQSTNICSNQSTNLYVYNSIPGIVYSLTKNGTQVGSTQNGNGNTLTFNSGSITTSSNLCLKGVKSITGCGSNIETWCTTVNIQNPNPATVMAFVQDTICVGTAASIELFASQIGVNYQLFKGATQIGSVQQGNGNNLLFSTPQNLTNTTYFIKGTSALSCVTNFPNMTIIVQNPGVYWTANTFNPEIGEPINLINNSTFPQGVFTWNFGVNTSPMVSNLTNPQGVIFNNVGIQNVSLTFVTPLGCSQTVNKTINVIPNFSEGSCDAVVLNSFGNSSSNLYSIDRDKNDNLYAVYKHSLNALNYTQSYHQDSLNLGLSPLNNYSKAYTLIKYNSKGVPMWSIALRSNTSGDGGDVICDSTGNVYVAYYHDNFGDSLRIYSSDGRFISIMPPNSGSNSQSVVIIKYNSNGNYLWHTTFLDDYTLWKVSLKIDQQQNLFASGIYRCVKYDPNGILQWQITGNFGDIETDQNGGAYILNLTGLGINHYASNGVLIESSLNPVTLQPTTVIGARYLTKDENGDLYALGNFGGSFIYGLDTLTDIYSFGGTHEDVYLAKFSNNLEHVWIKQFKGPSEMPLQGLDVSKNNVMASFLNNGATMEFHQLDTLFQNASNAYFIFKCDTTGQNEQITMFYKTTAAYIGSNIPNDNLKLSSDGSRFDFGFEYKDNFTASTGTNFTMTPSTGYKYYGINLAEVACVFSENTSNNLPTAYFSAPINICQGQTINFNDGSTNTPTQWNWTFQGGNINQSSLSNPIVTFNSSGTFPISLIASNSFGQSQVYTSYVQVSSLPDATVYGDDYICSGNYASVCINTTNSYSWPNGSTSGCYSIGPLTQDSTIFISVSIFGCQIELPFTFHVEDEQQISFFSNLPDSICSSESSFVLPTASPIGGTYSSDFAGISGNSFVPSNAGYNSFNYIYYTYSTPNAGCTTQSMDSIFVLNSDLWVTIQGDVQVCQDQSLNLYSTASSSVTDYHWNLNGGIGNDILSSSSTAIFNQPGNYQISLTVSNNQCQGPTVFHDVYVESTPNVELNDFLPNIVCSDAGLINVPTAIPSGGTYYDSQGALFDNFTLNTENMILDQPNYVYYFYSSPLGCVALDSTVITVTTCLGMIDNIESSYFISQGSADYSYFINNVDDGNVVIVYNQIGQIIIDEVAKENQLQIDLTEVSQGLYFVVIEDEENQSVLRILR